jgi:hypothetical protein
LHQGEIFADKEIIRTFGLLDSQGIESRKDRIPGESRKEKLSVYKKEKDTLRIKKGKYTWHNQKENKRKEEERRKKSAAGDQERGQEEKSVCLEQLEAYMCNRAINKCIALGTCGKKEEERGGQKVI